MNSRLLAQGSIVRHSKIGVPNDAMGHPRLTLWKPHYGSCLLCSESGHCLRHVSPPLRANWRHPAIEATIESPAGRRWQSDHWCAHWTHRGAEAMRFGGWRRLHAERRDPVGKESTMKPAKNSTQKSPKSTTATEKKPKGFTDEERVAMRERLQELKADARRGRRADKADGENAVLAKIAALPQPDRAVGERLHAIIKANAPALSPKTWYGMPAYAKDGNVVC